MQDNSFLEGETDAEAFDFDDSQENFDVKIPAIKLSDRPLFQILFTEAVADNAVLEAFGEQVLGELSDRFPLTAVSAQAFFQEREAELVRTTGRSQPDQSLRAQVLNGMIPALQIARSFQRWKAPLFLSWDERTERLFIVAYILHSLTKIEAVQQSLREKGFQDGEKLKEEQIPLLEELFSDWAGNLGMAVFLEPIGGLEQYLLELIYIACHTRRREESTSKSFMPQKRLLDVGTRQLLMDMSRLADLLATAAPSPRTLVANKDIRSLLDKLSFDPIRAQALGNLVCHHLAENRGILVNFIHKEVQLALCNTEWCIPLLYAPSGVVYLEARQAHALPSVDELVAKVVENIRQIAGSRTLETTVGSQLNKDGLRVQETFRDLFDLREIIRDSYRLLWQIRSNALQHMEYLESSGWPHTDKLPAYSRDKSDTRLRQLAEWASLLESQFEERLPSALDDYIDFIFEAWGIHELRSQFEDLRPYQQKGSGIRHRWYWVAAHALSKRSEQSADEILLWLQELSLNLAQQLPQNLPESAMANQGTWDDLSDYIKRILSLAAVKSTSAAPRNEVANYSYGKGKRGIALCSLCGSDYSVRPQLASSVLFQPWVYSARLKINANTNQRNICSICALEQLLQQLFVELDNLPTGKDAEAQAIRYLSFYPAHFFSGISLKMLEHVCKSIKSLRLSDKDLGRVLRNQEDLTDLRFWQRLEGFLFRSEHELDDPKFQKVLRYSDSAQASFFSLGFRNFDATETESWLLPSFFALVLAVCLDVKVVVSDSSLPLILESTDVPETIWLAGAPASLQSLIGHERLDRHKLAQVLARLTAAFLIHLDSEYSPPRENWQRFGTIVNALCDSPLYVFHYLKRQEQDGKRLGRNKLRRYIRYTKFFSRDGDPVLDIARQLVSLYRVFYRSWEIENSSSVLQPLRLATDAILTANPQLFKDNQSLVEIVYQQLRRFMDKRRPATSRGYFPKGLTEDARQNAMRDFSHVFVIRVFEDLFHKDLSALRGKQMTLLSDAAGFFYRDAQYTEWDEVGQRSRDESSNG